MFHSTKSIICLIILSVIVHAESIYRVDSIDDYRVSGHYQPALGDTFGTPMAFTAVPGVPVTVRCQVQNQVHHIPPGQAGWAREDYIQLVNLPPVRHSANAGLRDSLAGRFTISFAEPVLRGRPLADVSVRNGILYLPVIKSTAKTVAFDPPRPVFASGLRISIDTDGIYELTAAYLGSKGVPVSSIRSRAFRLFQGNTEVPIYVSNAHRTNMSPDDRILFYGKRLLKSNGRPTQYSYTNVYWLTWNQPGVGVRVAEAEGKLVADPTLYRSNDGTENDLYAREFRDTLHIEHDTEILWLGSVDTPQELGRLDPTNEHDNWFWGAVGSDVLTHFPIDIPSPSARGQARITVGLRGQTKSRDNSNDHEVSVLLNNRALLENDPQVAVWDGQEEHVFTSDPFPASRLLHGENTLTFHVERRGFPDRSALNWVRIEYPRGFRARNDRVGFSVHPLDIGSRKQFTVSGFSTEAIDIWDINNHRLFKNITQQKHGTGANTSYSFSFQDSVPGDARYVASSRSRRRRPQDALLDTIKSDATLLGTTGSVDYVMITSQEMRAALQPLADFHRSRGMNVALVNVEDVYNRYSYGIRNPESIRSFLRHLYARQSGTPPRYVLLGGDTSHDLDKKSHGRNIVPTTLSHAPGWGPCSDDGYFGLVNGNDNLTDLFIGRFPAQTPDHMQTMVAKTINYHIRRENGYWRDNLLLIGGLEQEFTDFNDALIGQVIGPRMNVIRIDAQPGSPFYVTGYTGTQQLAGHINSGVNMINFCGHGGGNVWWDSKLFSFTDLHLLHNDQWGSAGRLPHVFSFTCLTGFFESTAYASLGEEFLRHSSAGAVSFYGASAYTSRSGNFLMNRILMQDAVHDSLESLGELLWHCEMKTLAADKGRWLPLVRQYNLLGDPALPSRLPSRNLSVRLEENALTATDTLTLTGSSGQVTNGRAKIRVQADGKNIAESIVDVLNHSFSASFPLKNSFATTDGMVRAYAWNDSAEAHGWEWFSKNELLISDVNLTPVKPAPGDTAQVECYIATPSDEPVPPIRLLHALASSREKAVDFSVHPDISLALDSSGRWRSSKPLVIPTNPAPDDALHLKFRSIGTYGESKTYVFPLQGKPDLQFTDSTPQIFWRNDSLTIGLEIHNAGNKSAESFDIHLTVTDSSGTETFHAFDSQTLSAGETVSFTSRLPDLHGLLSIECNLDPEAALEESRSDNNTATTKMYLSYADLSIPEDTLFSFDSGLSVCPSKKLNREYRVFLFPHSVGDTAPLPTESRWIGITGDSLFAYHITSRPALKPSDSLTWAFHLDSAGLKGLSKTSAPTGGKVACMRYDSLDDAWRYYRSHISSENRLVMKTALPGPFAPAYLADGRPPVIDLSVAGRSVDRLDYAAKNHPFDIFITDPSTIDTRSVRAHLNGARLTQEQISSVEYEEKGTQARLTAYPPKRNRIDSLSIYASDMAGNDTTAVFAYLPGEDLSIRFLACHPNPFTAHQNSTGETIRTIRIAFLLTDVANSVTLTLYTISGKKVRVWSFNDLIGYQEIPWNGKSQNGYRIANGTYYLKLVARNDRKTVKKIVKIAKLEGY